MPDRNPRRYSVVFLLCMSVGVSGGCATTGAADPRDPLEGLNRGVYGFNQFMDEILFDPIGRGYAAITPEIVNTGVTNFFNNIGDISVVVNDLLQLKLGQAVSDLARLVFNSTIGLAGFFDVGSHIGLPKHDEDFGQTLAYWGVGSGPYVIVPLFGPATFREVAGFAVDQGLLNPVFYIDDDALRASLLALNYVDFKSDLLSARAVLGEAAIDEYEFVKNAYFERRAFLIHDGNPPPEEQ